jgi:DNA-binding CsgD family transcriptional regulator
MLHFFEVGRALTEIRTAKLYVASGYSTFEAYCKTRWSFTRQRAYQLMEAAAVTDNVKIFSQDVPVPTNDAQARELARLPADEQGAAWGEAVASAPDGKMSAALVRTVVNRRLRETEPAEDNSAVSTAPAQPAPAEHSYRSKECAARDKQIADLLDEGYGPGEIARLLGCKPHHVNDAKLRLGVAGGRKNPLAGILAQAVEFTDALVDARSRLSARLWSKASEGELSELLGQLEALSGASKALILAVGKHKQRRKSNVRKNEKAAAK